MPMGNYMDGRILQPAKMSFHLKCSKACKYKFDFDLLSEKETHSTTWKWRNRHMSLLSYLPFFLRSDGCSLQVVLTISVCCIMLYFAIGFATRIQKRVIWNDLCVIWPKRHVIYTCCRQGSWDHQLRDRALATRRRRMADGEEAERVLSQLLLLPRWVQVLLDILPVGVAGSRGQLRRGGWKSEQVQHVGHLRVDTVGKGIMGYLDTELQI